MFKSIILVAAIGLGYGSISWYHNLDEAKTVAHKENRHILLNFSGSDWCGPCIRMHREIFETQAFENMADSSLVMVNADFPRMKKDRLPAAQQKLNDAMADRYDSQGKFPYTVLLTADGKLLKAWDGFPGDTPDAFAREVRTAIENDK